MDGGTYQYQGWSHSHVTFTHIRRIHTKYDAVRTGKRLNKAKEAKTIRDLYNNN